MQRQLFLVLGSLVAAASFCPLMPGTELNTAEANHSRAQGSNPVPSHAENRARRIASMQDFHGVLCETASGGFVQILEVTWGANNSWALAPVYMKFLDQDGEIREIDRRERCRAVFNDLSMMSGVYLSLPQAHARIWADEISFATDQDGFLTMVGFSGMDDAGVPVALAPSTTSQMPPACAFKSVVGCTPDGCTGTCPNVLPCACVGGTGPCDEVLLQVCPHNGVCMVGTSCHISGMTCGCF